MLKEYRELAATYDVRWSRYIESTLEATMARLSLPPRARVLDVGCGTGALLAALTRECPDAMLAGIDPVPEMLGIARRRLTADVALYSGWAETLPFEDAAFDVVVSCSMFHCIVQPLAALEEMRRVLRPGGKVVITDWCDDYLTCRICTWYLRTFKGEQNVAYSVAGCRQMLEQTGWRHIEIERYKIDWLWGLMTATARVPGDTAMSFESVVNGLSGETLQSPSTGSPERKWRRPLSASD